MLKRTLILLVLILAQTGCTVYEEQGFYTPTKFTAESLKPLEQLKREFLTIEDTTVGDGPVAALGRKIIAEIEVRYADGDGTPIYRGPAITYFGMQGDVFIHNNVVEDGMLSTQQMGIQLGLNGMAVGSKRRIVIYPKLVCHQFGTEEANPNISCGLVYRNRLHEGPVKVRKEPLIVEATLTASCTPVFLDIIYLYRGEFRCRDSAVPQRNPSDPIWRVYHILPTQP